MYSSEILSRVIVHIYESKQWRAALDVTFFQADDHGFPLTVKTIEDDWMGCPPPAVISFAGTLVGQVSSYEHN